MCLVAENPFDVLKKEIKNKMTGRFDEKLAQISADMSKLQLFLGKTKKDINNRPKNIKICTRNHHTF